MADQVESTEEVENTGAEAHSVDDVFNDPEPEAAPASETQGEPAVQEATPAEAAPAAVASPATKEDDGLNHPALLGERRRRQEAEARLREAEEKLKIGEAKKAPDPIEDPDGYAAHIEAVSKGNEFKTRIAISRDLMIDANPDFEEVEKVFMGLVADESGNIIDESLFRKFQAAPNPARFAYNTAKEHLQVQEMKSPAYREKLKAEIRAEVEAEMKAKKTIPATNLPDLVKSTAAGSNSTPVEHLPELDELFAGSPI